MIVILQDFIFFCGLDRYSKVVNVQGIWMVWVDLKVRGR